MDKAKTEPTKREGALCCISTRTGGQFHSGGAGLLLSTASSSGRTSINYKQLFKYLALIQEHQGTNKTPVQVAVVQPQLQFGRCIWRKQGRPVFESKARDLGEVIEWWCVAGST